MPVRRSLLVGVSLCAALALGESAWATIDNQKSFKAAYPGKESKAYSCKVCHQGIVGKKGDLNAYGLALQTLKEGPGKALKLGVEDYKAIEQDDADADGASNLDEINAGTAPGDPASAPEGASAPSQPTANTDPQHANGKAIVEGGVSSPDQGGGQ